MTPTSEKFLCNYIESAYQKMIKQGIKKETAATACNAIQLNLMGSTDASIINLQPNLDELDGWVLGSISWWEDSEFWKQLFEDLGGDFSSSINTGFLNV